MCKHKIYFKCECSYSAASNPTNPDDDFILYVQDHLVTNRHVGVINSKGR